MIGFADGLDIRCKKEVENQLVDEQVSYSWMGATGAEGGGSGDQS